MTDYSVGLTTIPGRIRLEIGDQLINQQKGVRPDGVNFKDEELTLFYTSEGGDDAADPVDVFVGRAAAKACEVLAREYARKPTMTKMGPSTDSMTPTAYYHKLAKELRAQYGRKQPLAAPRLFPSGTARVAVLPAGAYSS